MKQPDQDISEPTDEEIALGAYRLWLQEGCPSGRDKEHWLKSRELLLARRAAEKIAAENRPQGAVHEIHGNP